MNFSSDDAARVYAIYEKRNAQETERISALPAGVGFKVRDELLLPVGPEVGSFLHSLIIAKRPRRVLELGTSYGYSTLFIADAVSQTGGMLITMELADYKQNYARDMLGKAGLADCVEFQLGDAPSLIEAAGGTFDFVLLDIWKELYVPCFDAFYPKLAEEAIILADNMIEPAMARPDVRRYRATLKAKDDLHSVLLPIGSGIEVSCKWAASSTKL